MPRLGYSVFSQDKEGSEYREDNDVFGERLGIIRLQVQLTHC